MDVSLIFLDASCSNDMYIKECQFPGSPLRAFEPAPLSRTSPPISLKCLSDAVDTQPALTSLSVNANLGA